MTEYLVAEDERLAYEEIRRMMSRLRPEYEIAGWAESVESAASFLRRGGVDLVILDIRLADGLGFEIFEQCHVDVPVIFTTAYDEYALRAFSVNSIDYLLKPVEERELAAAIGKFERRCALRSASPQYGQLEADYLQGSKKTRFLVSVGDTFRYVATADVAFFYSEEKYTYLCPFDGGRYIVDYSLDKIERVVDGTQFFRVARNCVANIRGIAKVSRFFSGRLLLHLKPECPQRIVVSRSRAGDFLRWLDDIR